MVCTERFEARCLKAQASPVVRHLRLVPDLEAYAVRLFQQTWKERCRPNNRSVITLMILTTFFLRTSVSISVLNRQPTLGWGLYFYIEAAAYSWMSLYFYTEASYLVSSRVWFIYAVLTNRIVVLSEGDRRHYIEVAVYSWISMYFYTEASYLWWAVVHGSSMCFLPSRGTGLWFWVRGIDGMKPRNRSGYLQLHIMARLPTLTGEWHQTAQHHLILLRISHCF
jgi:hypothetical protein